MTNHPQTPLANLLTNSILGLFSVLGIVSLLLFSQVFLPTARAQTGTGPFDEEPEISATVPDHIDPSTPVLISPENNALLNTATPTFVWQASSDNVAISHYTIYKDGSIWYDNLPTGDQETSNYTYTYDSSTNYYSFTPKNLLDNGTYTWKIVATDTSDNSAESVTWTYSIDTKAPTFVIEQVGNQETTISAQDPSTHPEDPINLQANEPLLTGSGEVSSTVSVTITTPNDEESDSFTIGSDGSWELQLGILPQDVIIYLDFIITDQAGNVSVLSDVPLILKSAPVVTPTATPGVSPREWRQELLRRAEPLLPLSLRELTKEQLIITPQPEPLRIQILQVGALFALLTPALAKFTLLLFTFGQHLTLSSLPFLAGLAGILPYRNKYAGIVFATDTNQPVAFARVIFNGTTNDGKHIHQQVLANDEGFFRPPKLPAGNYLASANHPGYHFPTGLTRENHLDIRDYYLGEQFKVSSKQVAQQLCIPVDSENLQKDPWAYSLIKSLSIGQVISWISFIIAGLITLFFPTKWNLLVVGLYILLIVAKLMRPYFIARGTVVDGSGTPLEGVVLRFSDPANGQTLTLTKTNKNGRYTYHQFPELPPDDQEQANQEENWNGKPIALIKYGWQLDRIATKEELVARPTR